MKGSKDSVFPEEDREWLVQLIKDQEARLVSVISGVETRLGERIGKLEERQAEHDRALRNSSETDVLLERRLGATQVELARISTNAGAVAGKESAESTSKKWGVIYALIALATTVVNSLIGAQKNQEPAIPPKEEIHAPTHAAAR